METKTGIISNSDLFIYVGGESDKWVPSVLEQVSNKDLKAINLMKYINADLRTKMSESSKIGDDDPDLAEDSEYVKDFKKTGKFAWIWILLVIAIVIAVVVITLNS